MIRSTPEGKRTAGTLRDLGHEVMLAPLMRIEPVALDLKAGSWNGVVISSANALGAMDKLTGFQRLTTLPLWAVGDRSAAAAAAAGFADVTSAGGALVDLAALLRQKVPPGQRLLYLAGADRVDDLGALLAPDGIIVDTRVAYRATPLETLPESVSDALRAGQLDGILHYSRRAVETLLAAAAAAGVTAAVLRPVQFCLSARIAEPLTAAGAPTIRIAAKPSEAALLKLIDSP